MQLPQVCRKKAGLRSLYPVTKSRWFPETGGLLFVLQCCKWRSTMLTLILLNLIVAPYQSLSCGNLLLRNVAGFTEVEVEDDKNAVIFVNYQPPDFPSDGLEIRCVRRSLDVNWDFSSLPNYSRSYIKVDGKLLLKESYDYYPKESPGLVYYSLVVLESGGSRYWIFGVMRNRETEKLFDRIVDEIRPLR
jgi:hypothetical protein